MGTSKTKPTANQVVRPDHQRQRHHAPLDVPGTEELGESPGQDLRAPRLRQQLAEHGAEANHSGDAAQGGADAIAERLDHGQHGVRGMPGGGDRGARQPDRDGPHQQATPASRR